GHVGAVPLNRALVSRTRAGTVATQINGNGLVVRREMRHLRVPVAMRTSEPVNKNDRRTTLTYDDVMNQWHLHLVEVESGHSLRRQLPHCQLSGPPSSVIRCISRCSP